ncbi:chemotaxis protein CheD [Terriglobus tenax]|uniref:chemotaxis protein CheD n=1 Tax=Terriglobus tenax TaxID=1111115 RepID=UPI0021E0758A|nr:chemotaxis protein CheD [Terriglobus tenax]
MVQHVMIAQLKAASAGMLKATLGSCVALGLINRKTGLCGLAHCLLAHAPAGADVADARYVDRALPNLIRIVGGLNPVRRHLKGFLAGGANMIHSADTEKRTVGSLNLEAARTAFKANQISFEELETGGMQGYTVVLDCNTKLLTCCFIDPMTTE